MKIVMRLMMPLVTLAIALGQTGCATWIKHDRPTPPIGYRMEKPLPIKAIEVRVHANAMGINVDTDTDSQLYAKFRVVYANGSSRAGIMRPNQTVYYDDQIKLSLPDRQGRQMLSPQSYYPPQFNQQLRNEHNADMALSLAILAMQGFDALMSPGRYTKLKQSQPEEIKSLDIEISYAAWADPRLKGWSETVANQLVETGATSVRPPLILTSNERKRIASFINQLAQDFPRATIRRPAFYTAMLDYLATLSETDTVLHLDVKHTPDRNMALVISHGIVSGLTLFVLPWSIPQRFSSEATLQDLTGKELAKVNSSARNSLVIGVPLVFFAFAEEHNTMTSAGRMEKAACRTLLKDIRDKCQN